MFQVPISPGAAAVNKFSLNNGVLSREGQTLTSVTMQQGIKVSRWELLCYFSAVRFDLQDFFEWCQQLSQQQGGSTITLVAHNGRNVGKHFVLSIVYKILFVV